MAPSRDPSEVKVLVVCLGMWIHTVSKEQRISPFIEFIIPQSSGNICRSPMGEAVLQHIAKERGLDIKVDSAGTAGYHVGEEPDER